MTKTKIDTSLLKEVENLATLGFNNRMISKALNLGVSTLSRNEQLKQAIQIGKLALAKNVTEEMLASLKDSPQNQQFLVKRLGLFNQEINLVAPKNAKQALKNLSVAIKQFSQGLISESQLRTVEATSNSYIKGFEISDLEDRITELEKVASERR